MAPDPAPLTITLPRPVGGLCDFCGTPGPTWAHPCGPFTRTAAADPTTLIKMSGPWLACDTCHGHIDADRWIALLDHSMNHHGTALTTDHQLAVLRSELAACWLQFRHHRNGPAALIG